MFSRRSRSNTKEPATDLAQVKQHHLESLRECVSSIVYHRQRYHATTPAGRREASKATAITTTSSKQKSRSHLGRWAETLASLTEVSPECGLAEWGEELRARIVDAGYVVTKADFLTVVRDETENEQWQWEVMYNLRESLKPYPELRQKYSN
jgi:hypothetical protein